MKKFIIYLSSIFFLLQCTNENRKIIIGITDSWDTSIVILRTFQKSHGTWKLINEFPGTVGKKGIAWSEDFIKKDENFLSKLSQINLIKREGDKKAPAGIFSLGSLYGYNVKNSINPKWKIHSYH